MKYSFYWRFDFEVEADCEKDACLATAKVFKEEVSAWRGDRPSTWKKQLHSPDLNLTKKVKVDV